ncbi:hypothetical protein ACRALDRAFT_2107051, partial [Sodiomyces alcalophilus JCM 7366]|uniref:uncharacterized protein n=1 Tax=Sodiomyces alcalophilus JCM 7366 TaxID=591952 RepID=UPI0039B4779E
QAVVDRVVDDLAYTLGFGRMDLNIVLLIPSSSDVGNLELGTTRWLLVIEKEAVYQDLTETVSTLAYKFQGKGFPDLVTRGFLHLVQSTRPQLPIYCLADFDPDGIGIMRCYKHGSRSLSHETHIDAPRLRWLGFKSSDVTVASGSCRPSVTAPMSIRDRRRAEKLLSTLDEESHDWEELECRRELQVMMFLGVKAEIQGVDGMGEVEDWLDAKLGSCDGLCIA